MKDLKVRISDIAIGIYRCEDVLSDWEKKRLDELLQKCETIINIGVERKMKSINK